MFPSHFPSRLISYEEFSAFEGRLCVPDALYRTAFQLFDTNGNGTVSFSKERNLFNAILPHLKFLVTALESKWKKFRHDECISSSS